MKSDEQSMIFDEKWRTISGTHYCVPFYSCVACSLSFCLFLTVSCFLLCFICSVVVLFLFLLLTCFAVGFCICFLCVSVSQYVCSSFVVFFFLFPLFCLVSVFFMFLVILHFLRLCLYCSLSLFLSVVFLFLTISICL